MNYSELTLQLTKIKTFKLMTHSVFLEMFIEKMKSMVLTILYSIKWKGFPYIILKKSIISKQVRKYQLIKMRLFKTKSPVGGFKPPTPAASVKWTCCGLPKMDEFPTMSKMLGPK